MHQHNPPFGPAFSLAGWPSAYLSGGTSLAQRNPVPPHILALLEKSIEDFRPSRDDISCRPPLTHAALLLDSSDSMKKHKSAVIEGYNSQVNVISEGAASAGETLVSVTVFNSVSSRILSAEPVCRLTEMSPDNYQPTGSTALFDALGETIAFLLQQPNASEPSTAFLVAAFTDGEENCSTCYTGQILKELIARLEATGRWTFTLMGPNGGAQEMASALSIQPGNVAGFDPGKIESVRTAFAGMADASQSYMSARAVGATACANLYENLAGNSR